MDTPEESSANPRELGDATTQSGIYFRIVTEDLKFIGNTILTADLPALYRLLATKKEGEALSPSPVI